MNYLSRIRKGKETSQEEEYVKDWDEKDWADYKKSRKMDKIFANSTEMNEKMDIIQHAFYKALWIITIHRDGDIWPLSVMSNKKLRGFR